jgi:hypothetical protein
MRLKHEAQESKHYIPSSSLGGGKEELDREWCILIFILKGGKEGLTIEHYQRGREVVMVMLDWVGEQLFPTFNPPWMEMISITYSDFVALALCNQELHKISHQGSFFKVYKQGCMERKDMWMDKQLEEH